MNRVNNLTPVVVFLFCLNMTFDAMSYPMLKTDTGQKIIHVYFNFNSYNIKPDEISLLNQLSSQIKKSRNTYKVRISGYCDSIGNDIYNDQLSLQRANSVKNRLVKGGINSNDILISGYGKRKPMNKNSNEEERKANRRVDIELILNSRPGKEGLGSLKENMKTGTHITLKAMDFEGGMHNLLPEFLPELDTLVRIMQTHPKLEIKILGYICCLENGIDGVDLETGTQNLSVNRAKAVYDYLIKNKIAKTRLSYQGMGSRNKIIYPEITEEDKTLNRRVEIVVMKE